MSREEHSGLSIIHEMSEDLSNQIAAGEVVERPASAVKELVENAIDADATRVRVELEEGGLHLIRVSDNGCGMGPRDAELCVRRHATSKLLSREALFSIETLGFRGEALPSIASVSRFELLTRNRKSLAATRVCIEGGAAPVITEASGPVGTEVVVRDLFFNTPARLKFLKTRSTEVKNVVRVIQRIAMAQPRVGFTLSHNGRVVLELPAVNDAFERVRAIFERRDAQHIFPLREAQQDGVICRGFFAAPELTRRTNEGIWCFVNGRFIRDRSIMGAIRVAYQGLVDRGRFPVCVLFLEVEPWAVDVNVHPTKVEVRFHDSAAVFRAVRRSLAESLALSPWVADGEGTTISNPQVPVPSREDLPELKLAAPTLPFGDRPTPVQQEMPVRTYSLHRAGGAAERESDPLIRARNMRIDRPAGGTLFPSNSVSSSASKGTVLGELASADVEVSAGYFSALHYIGHYRHIYLLCSEPRGLVVVDQHAAHERIRYEVLKDIWEGRNVEQPALVPEVLALDSLRAATLHEELEFFRRLGFEIEHFGGQDFAVRSIPAILGRCNIRTILVDAIDELADTGQSSRVQEARDAVLIRMACHESVRGGDELTREEVHALFEQMDRIPQGGNCPHGRPVFFRMGLNELEERFQRR